VEEEEGEEEEEEEEEGEEGEVAVLQRSVAMLLQTKQT
jgi:hypothetical protein